MRRSLCLLATMAALGLLAGCDRVLGLERRTYGGPSNACTSALECEQGRFCDAGSCVATPPTTDLPCAVFEPANEPTAISAFDWTARHHVLGVLARTNNTGEVPRVDAIRLAVREINEAGGIRETGGPNTPLAMVVCDYGGAMGLDAGNEAATAIGASLELLGPGLGARVAIAASSSSATNSAIVHLTTNALPVALISPFSTSPALNDFDDRLPGGTAGLLWRTAPDDTYQAKALAKLVDEDVKVSRLAILYVDDSYGKSLQEALRGELKKLPRMLDASIAALGVTPKPEDFASKVASLAADSTNGLLIVGSDGPFAVEALKAVVAGGYTGTFPSIFLADAAKEQSTLLDSTLSTEVKALIKTARGTAPYHSDGVHYGTFAAGYLETFKIDASAFSFLANSYDAAYLAGYALSWAHASGEIFDGRRVAEGLASLSSGDTIAVGETTWNTASERLTNLALSPRTINVDGTSGPLDFGANGQASGPIEIWRATSDLSAFEHCAVCFATKDECEPSPCLSP